METMTLEEALRGIDFVADFSPETIRHLAAMAKYKRCSRGTVLFREGEHSDAFYVVHSGHVSLEMCLPAHGCTQLLTLGPGETVAWSALVGNGCMTANARATDDVELIEFSGADLIAKCEADPNFGYHLMRRLAAALAKRLLATRLQMLDLFMADASSSGKGNV